MDKCYFYGYGCRNIDVEYCKLCDELLCKDCRKNPLRRVKGLLNKKVSDFLGSLKRKEIG